MRKLIFLNIILIWTLSSCNSRKNYKVEPKIATIPRLTDITSYTGNAVALLHEAGPSMILIPVLEKDSNKFKKEDYFKLIKGQCSISIFVGDYQKRVLLISKEKKKLDQKGCNTGSATHYIKIWISYKNFEENLHKKRDSCDTRDLGSHPNKSKIIKLIILTDAN